MATPVRRGRPAALSAGPSSTGESPTSRTCRADPATSCGAPRAGWHLPEHRRRCPILRDGVPIGAHRVSRDPSRRPFTDRQIELLRDLRRPGRHRHRERPAVQGAGGPEPRPDRDAGAADGDQRDPARHLAARRPTSSRSSTRSPRARRGSASAVLRASSGSTASCSTSSRRQDSRPRRCDAVREPSRCGRARGAPPGGPCSTRRYRSHPGRLADPDYAVRHAGAARPAFRSIAGGPDAPRGQRRSVRSPSRAARRGPFSGPADRAAQDLRRPGGHRHRERPPVQGAGGAQPRPDRGAGAADGHRRDPARHLAARRPTSSRSSKRSSRPPRASAGPRTSRSSGSTAPPSGGPPRWASFTTCSSASSAAWPRSRSRSREAR